MTKDASFKKVVRRHAEETGQRYTAARGSPARFPPPARPRAGVGGDAAILSFLERQDYLAERLAADDAVSDFDGSAVLVTRFVEGVQLPDGAAKFAMMGELLGRLHALPYDETAGRPGGASGEDPSREGTPRQDLLAALSFLDAVDTKVAAAERERFEQLRDQVRAADDGHGLPEGLLHGNLLHTPGSRRPERTRTSRDQLEGVRARTAPRRLQLSRGRDPSRVPPVGRRANAFDRPAGTFGGAHVSAPVGPASQTAGRVTCWLASWARRAKPKSGGGPVTGTLALTIRSGAPDA